MYTLWQDKSLPTPMLLVGLQFAHRAFEGILAAHRTAQCDEASCCWHTHRILEVAAKHRTRRSKPHTRHFPYHLSSCGGSVWILNSILAQITCNWGKYGTTTLDHTWKVRVSDSRRDISIDIVKSMLQNFLQMRNLQALSLRISDVVPWDQLTYATYETVQDRLQHDETWFRIPFDETIMQESSSSTWPQRAWHGFKLESLASILKNGIMESGPKVPGARNETPGIYCCGDNHVHRAAGYANVVPSGDNLYWSAMSELQVDRNQLIPCQGKGQWTQPASSVKRTALRIRTVNLHDMHNGEGVQAL